MGVIFLAELADKTQVVGIGMSAKSETPASVFPGSVCAYAVVTVLSVLIGARLGRYLKPDMVRYAGATIFVVIGIVMFLGKL